MPGKSPRKSPKKSKTSPKSKSGDAKEKGTPKTKDKPNTAETETSPERKDTENEEDDEEDEEEEEKEEPIELDFDDDEEEMLTKARMLQYLATEEQEKTAMEDHLESINTEIPISHLRWDTQLKWQIRNLSETRIQQVMASVMANPPLMCVQAPVKNNGSMFPPTYHPPCDLFACIHP